MIASINNRFLPQLTALVTAFCQWLLLALLLSSKRLILPPLVCEKYPEMFIIVK